MSWLYYHISIASMLLRIFLSIVSVGCETTHLVPTLLKWHYIGSLEMATVGVFTLWKLANIPNQSLVYCFADFLDLRKC